MKIPFPWLPGADVLGSLAEAQQANNDAFALAVASGLPAWQTPAFANGWVSYGASDPPGFRVNNGYLEFRGAIKSGTLAASQLVLSTGVTLAQRAAVVVLVDNTTDQLGAVIVNTDGTVQQNRALPSNVFVSLVAIRVPVT